MAYQTRGHQGSRYGDDHLCGNNEGEASRENDDVVRHGTLRCSLKHQDTLCLIAAVPPDFFNAGKLWQKQCSETQENRY
ncbi:hypothetical protein PoB_005134800 [Plakobranchus ocellatus]|uniref:Uncharacterized protein n=1 Tax=Plakobranchus ocellatus TaxID=259542 RepID=A0AAV4C0A1_9GAST|nr:hypothetical protein PoB_005134800 [Plakobranchus ocellatus]